MCVPTISHKTTATGAQQQQGQQQQQQRQLPPPVPSTTPVTTGDGSSHDSCDDRDGVKDVLVAEIEECLSNDIDDDDDVNVDNLLGENPFDDLNLVYDLDDVVVEDIDLEDESVVAVEDVDDVDVDCDDDDGDVEDDLPPTTMKTVGLLRFSDVIVYHGVPIEHTPYYFSNSIPRGSGGTTMSSFFTLSSSGGTRCYRDQLWWSKREIQKIEKDALEELEKIIFNADTSNSNTEDDFPDNRQKEEEEEALGATSNDTDNADDDETLEMKLRGLERILYGLFDDEYSDKKQAAIQSMLLHLSACSSSSSSFISSSSLLDDSSSTGSNGSSSNGSSSSSSDEVSSLQRSSAGTCTTIYTEFVSQCVSRAKTFAVIDEIVAKKHSNKMSQEELIYQVQQEQLEELLRKKQEIVDEENMKMERIEEQQARRQAARRRSASRGARSSSSSRRISLPSMKEMVGKYSCISNTRRSSSWNTTAKPLLDPLTLDEDDYMIAEDEFDQSSSLTAAETRCESPTELPPPPAPPASPPPSSQGRPISPDSVMGVISSPSRRKSFEQSLCVPSLPSVTGTTIRSPMKTMEKRVSAIYNYVAGDTTHHIERPLPNNVDWEDFLTE